MECRLSNATVNYEVYGEGRPVLIIHGFSIDHRAMVGCFEPVFENKPGYKRIYIDLPGMGKTKGEAWIQGTDDMLKVVMEFIDEVLPDQNFLLAGQSYGGYLARGIVAKRPEQVDGVALVVPMIISDFEKRELPQPQALVQDSDFLETLDPQLRDEFASLAVVQDRYNFDRTMQEIIPGSNIANQRFLVKIRNSYGFSFDPDALETPFAKPSLIITGRQDASCGYADAFRILYNYPRATYATLDLAGHNLHIEQKTLFDALVEEWLERSQGNGA